MEKERVPVCPRCGSPYSYVEEREVGEQVYLYAVHYYYAGEGRRRRRRKRRCYLGPKSSYVYAEGLLSLGLSGLETVDFVAVAVNAVTRLGAAVEAAETEGDRATLLRIEAGMHEVIREAKGLAERAREAARRIGKGRKVVSR